MKKFLLNLLSTMAFGLAATGAMAQGVVDCPSGCPQVDTPYIWATSFPTGGTNFTFNVSGIDYTIYATALGSYTNLNGAGGTSAFNSTNMAWFGNQALARTLAGDLKMQLGNYGQYSPPGSDIGILFAYAPPVAGTGSASGYTVVPIEYWSTTAGAPEIDGSLAPKVGFLLGCLFLMFGRKKQNTEPMMTA